MRWYDLNGRKEGRKIFVIFVIGGIILYISMYLPSGVIFLFLFEYLIIPRYILNHFAKLEIKVHY